MRQLLGRICLFLGIFLLCAAVGLLYYNTWESQHAMKASGSVLYTLQQTQKGITAERTAFSETTYYKESYEAPLAGQLDEPIEAPLEPTHKEPIESSSAEFLAPSYDTPDIEPLFPFDTPAKEMKVVEIDGYDYIGTLSIPVLGVELPVMAELDYSRLKIAPCRQCGSVYANDLVIAAHNYTSHFGSLQQLRTDDLLTFTDMEGVAHLYHVEVIDIVQPTAVDAVVNSPFDLVLYTCTYGGKNRVVAFCNRVPL